MNLDFRVNGSTKLTGLIGNPVEHTVSPVLQNSLFLATGINGIYLPLKAQEGCLRDVVNGLKAVGFVGFNVTIPYKGAIMEYLDEISEEAALLEAVNTVKITGDRLLGYNTDGDGFLRAFSEQTGADFSKKSVCILGAGGTARTLAIKIALEGADEICIINRTLSNATLLAEKINRIMGRQGQVKRISNRTGNSDAPTAAIEGVLAVSNPVAATAMSSNPMAKTAASSSPMAKTTASSNPVAATAMSSNPVAATAMSSNPVAATTMSSNPVAATAMSSNPMAKTAASSSPMPATETAKAYAFAAAAGSPESMLALSQCDIIINATSVGMHPDIEACPLVEGFSFRKEQIIYDVIYNPVETKLMALARHSGCIGVNGASMLFYQGVKAFEIWMGSIISTKKLEDLSKVFLKYLQG